MQYLTTVNPYGPTTYFYVTLADVATDPFLAFAMALADLVEPIYVASISWGSIEGEEVPSIMASFDVEAAKLGLKGGTIVVSSGDDGANGLGTECGYAPSFPASSPNVLAVGATNAYDWSGTAGAPNEIVCQADVLGGVVTSGGGFSGTYAQPYWQADAVASYFAQVDGTQQQPAGGFSKGGRGYPDVALAGKDFEVVIGDVLYLVSGTSASAPSVAGMLARINAGLLAAGKAPVGLVNPTLYASGGSFANDIVDGDNTCTAYLLECEQGFYATTGWDPGLRLGLRRLRAPRAPSHGGRKPGRSAHHSMDFERAASQSLSVAQSWRGDVVLATRPGHDGSRILAGLYNERSSSTRRLKSPPRKQAVYDSKARRATAHCHGPQPVDARSSARPSAPHARLAISSGSSHAPTGIESWTPPLSKGSGNGAGISTNSVGGIGAPSTTHNRP